MIYLDNSATTFPKPEPVYSAMDYAQRQLAFNAGRGNYKVASDASELIEETKLLLAEMLCVDNPRNIVFSPSATIAANQVIFGLEWDKYKVVYVTPFEHNAIARPLEKIKQIFGVEIKQLPFSGDSQVLNVEEMEVMFSDTPPDYVFINHISNVTGAILPVETITRAAKKYEAIVVVDGSQSVGLIDYHLSSELFDYLIFAGHKNLYASFGIGGFIKNSDRMIESFFAGGNGSDSLSLHMGKSFPSSFEIGSPNIVAIASLNAALKWIQDVGISKIRKKKKCLTQYLIEKMNECRVKLYLPSNLDMHTSILSFNIDGYLSNEVGMILSEDYNIAVRTGYHCAPFVHSLINSYEFSGTVRVSLGYFNSTEDIDVLIKAIDDI